MKFWQVVYVSPNIFHCFLCLKTKDECHLQGDPRDKPKPGRMAPYFHKLLQVCIHYDRFGHICKTFEGEGDHMEQPKENLIWSTKGQF